MRKRSLLALPLAMIAAQAQAGVVVKQAQGAGLYDPVTLEIDGPRLDVMKGANPFADYRLDVTISDGGKSWNVPAYFAGCGDAADKTCTAGRLWRAHFVPAHGGAWTYALHFRTGVDIVAKGGEGSAVAGDGASGQFTVADKARNAIRARGLLTYTGDPYYRWSGSKAVFFKFGTDAPENFLAYDGFDNTPNTRGLRKNWAPHIRDYKADSAAPFTWGQGKGKGLLGSMAYMQSVGANSISMLLFNVGGDDRNVIPQIMRVPAATYEKMAPDIQWKEGVWHDRYDLTKLAQWQRALSYADELGLHMHFKLEETENDKFMDGGALGRERRIYMREMVARFGHFLALTWNLGEENVQTTQDQIDESRYIAALDPYGHPLVLHTHPDEHETYRPLLGVASALNGVSIQGGTFRFWDMRPDITKWASLSRAAGRNWVIGYDEQGAAAGGAPVDDDYPAAQLPNKWNDKNPDRQTFRRGAIWNVFTAGASGMEVYYGYKTGCTDLDCQDHRTRAHVWADGKAALDFFEQHIGAEAIAMQPDDDLTFTPSDYVLAHLGQTYVIYTAEKGIVNPNGGPAEALEDNGPRNRGGREPRLLQLYGYPGRYSVSWYDAQKGGALQKGSVTQVSGGANADLGDPPAGGSGEWAILVRRQP